MKKFNHYMAPGGIRVIRLGLAKTIGMAVLAATFFAPLGPMAVQADSPAAKSTAPAGKVTICHKGHVVITIAREALDAHLAHGDSIGSCVVTTVN